MSELALARRPTRRVDVDGVAIGGGAPIVVQSMTNTDTADVAATVAQVMALADAGSELVRVTVNTAEAAAAVPAIRDRARRRRLPRAADRRFPLQRPQAPHRASRLRARARQVPDQSRQRRQGQQARSAVRGDDRKGDRARQADPHRRQLGQPRRRAPRADDGRERRDGRRRAARMRVMREALVVSAIDSAQRAEELGLAARPHRAVVQGVRACRT